MSDISQGPGWWQASDLKWYPPEAVPAGAPSPPQAVRVPGPYVAPATPVATQSTNGLAVASLVLSILWIWGLGSLLAIIFSITGKRQITRSNGTQSGGGLAVAGLVIGIVGLVGSVLVTILVVAAGTALNITAQNAVVAQCQADAKTMATALESYKAETGSYPAAGNGSQLLATTSVDGNTIGPFLRQLPSTTYYTVWTDGRGGVYVYPSSQTTTPTSFSSADDFFTGTPCTSFVSVP
jgi:Domain of unknown function (DUF4190)/Type II secretion system (T2SS), protein G